MQIVIDIPKGFYEHVKGHKDIFTYGLVNGEKIGEIIAKGIVLPEQYGDLIDRNVFASDEYLERRYGTDFYWEFRRRLDKQNAIIKSNRIKNNT